MPLGIVLEGFGSGSEGGDESLPGDSVRAELDAGNLAKQVSRYVDGSGLSDDAGRPYENDVERRVPAEALHVNPDPAAKATGDCAYSAPEVHTLRRLGDRCVLEVLRNPVGVVAGHTQSPQETAEVLTPVGMISGGA